MTESTIDFPRLEKLRRLASGDVISACPACREIGKDGKGDNLRVFASGAFHCIAVPDDKEHNRQIFALVGIKGERAHDPEKDKEWRQLRDKERAENHKREVIAKKAKDTRAAIIARHDWPLANVWEDSPQRIDCDLVAYDPRHFLASLFPQDAVIWTGETSHSGKHPSAEHSWKTVSEWQDLAPQLIGPMVTPATWKADCLSRTAANVVSAPFVVLDFDGFDGISPETPQEIETHIVSSLALIRWMREKMRWSLVAILHTGNKSLHAWFHTPPPEVLASLKPVAKSFGIDAGLIDQPEHPCRLPGHLHQKTATMSRVLWMQTAPCT